jgi:hypothetical protein
LRAVGRPEPLNESRKVMAEDFGQLDDPALIAESERIRAVVDALADRYQALSAEFSRRAAGRWTQ